MAPFCDCYKIHKINYNSCHCPTWADRIIISWPWCDGHRVGAALLEGIMEDTWMESMDGLGSNTPQAHLLWHYLDMNRSGRRILVYSQPVSDDCGPGSWNEPGKRVSRPRYASLWDFGQPIRPSFSQVNTVYFFLRNFPNLLSFQS